MKYRAALLIVFLIILVDQVSKIYVKTHFYNGEEINVIGHWFRLHFLENPGMAFGMQFSKTDIGKLILTSFRLVAVIIGFIALKKLVLKGYSRGVIVCGALILAGALGNLIDRLLFGYVVDFISVYYADWRFATFNIADAAISIGAALLVLDILVGVRANGK